MFDPKDIDEHPIYGDLYSSNEEPQYIRDKRIQAKFDQNQQLLSSALEQNLDGESMAEVNHAYNEI